MQKYQELCIQWAAVRENMTEKEWESLLTLFSVADERQVESSFHLLLAYGESALCALFEVSEHQILLKESMKMHRFYWGMCILEELLLSEGAWNQLFQEGHFHHFLRFLYGKVSWESLSVRQKELVCTYSLRFVDVPSGSFMMGACPNDKDAEDNEFPRHRVQLMRNMQVGSYLCTQGLYASVMGRNPSRFTGLLCPVDKVSWCDAILFCNKLSEKEGYELCYEVPKELSLHCKRQKSWQSDEVDALSKKIKWNREANGYRLPTEAEWEYCARGGSEHIYAGSNHVDEVAWHKGNSTYTQFVGAKKNNGFGLYDMSGNAWEWVWDTWDEDAYNRGERFDPISIQSSVKRMFRGGSWFFPADYARVSIRSYRDASVRNTRQSFRIWRNLE